jgi:hypothetical protein
MLFNKLLEKYKNIENIYINVIAGVFLLFLAISGNFLVETLNCHTQQLLTNSVVAKQVMIFFIIFFTIDFSNLVVEKPSVKLVKTVMVYIFYLLFTKMNKKPTLIVFILLIITYIVNSYKRYYRFRYEEITNSSIELHKEKKHHQQYADYLLRLEAILLFTIMVTILVGFYYYYNQKLKQDKKLKLLDLLTNIVKCDKSCKTYYLK